MKLFFQAQERKDVERSEGKKHSGAEVGKPYGMPWRCVEGRGNQGLIIGVGGGNFS